MEVVWEGEHFEILESEDGYEAVHEPDSVIMLPRVEDQVIARLEPCPAYQVKDTESHFWTPVCGTCEPGEKVFETLRREMGEETPILPERIRVLEEHRRSPYTKLTTQRIHFFFFDVLEYERTEAPGDGSEYEENSRHVFLEESEMLEIADQDNSDLPFKFCAEVLRNT